MFDFFPEIIKTNIPFILLIAIGAVALVFAFWLYKKTVPEITSIKKYSLGTIRTVVFLLLILFLFTPKLFLTFKEEKRPEIAVFVDNSQSMGINEGDKNRWQDVDTLIRRLKYLLPKNAQIDWFIFNKNVQLLSEDSLRPQQFSTNFANVFEKLNQSTYKKALIISDGNITEGGYPLHSQFDNKTKILTIGIGDTALRPDVYVSNVIYKNVAYSEQSQEIEAQIGSQNISESKPITLDLISGGQVVAKKIINTSTSNTEQSVVLEYTPKRLGLKKLQVRLAALEQEDNRSNNSYTFVQEILKNKLQIGIFSGVPSYETKFIKFLLDATDNFSTYTYVEKRSGDYLLNPDIRIIDSLDVFIFQDYPGPYSRAENVNRLLTVFRQRKPALITITGERVKIPLLDRFQDYLPFSSLRKNNQPVDVTVSSETVNLFNPLVNLFKSEEETILFWNKIPPLTLYHNFNIKDKGELVIRGKGAGKNFNVGAIYEEQNIKSALLNGSGFWRWHFAIHDQDNLRDGFANLLNYLVRWTSNKTKSQPLALKISDKTPFLGEQIEITANLYDANFRPVRDGNLMMEANWRNQQFIIETESDSAGNYIARFTPPGEGSYTVNAEGYQGGNFLGKNQLSFEVIPFDKELINTAPNVDFLRRVARQGGGAYVTASNIEKLAPEFTVKTEYQFEDQLIEIWYAPFMLFIIIILISTEWILRKRFGLV